MELISSGEKDKLQRQIIKNEAKAGRGKLKPHQDKLNNLNLKLSLFSFQVAVHGSL